MTLWDPNKRPPQIHVEISVIAVLERIIGDGRYLYQAWGDGRIRRVRSHPRPFVQKFMTRDEALDDIHALRRAGYHHTTWYESSIPDDEPAALGHILDEEG